MRFTAGVTGLLVIAFAAGLAAPSGPASRPLHVVTTFLPVYCFTAQVAGRFAQVENLLPASAPPHDYQFSRKDLEKLERADLIVLNGLGVEDWLEKALAANPRTAAKTFVRLSDGLDAELIRGRPRLDNGALRRIANRTASVNPHIWLDPHLAMHGVSNILVALRRADPPNAANYSDQAARFIGRLEILDRELDQRLEPVRRRPLLTYHDAFPYFARRYGLNQVGVVEEIPDVEPSPRHLTAVLQTARATGVRTLYTEPQYSSRLIVQLSRDLKIGLGELDPLETGPLRPDAYEEGMRRNLRALEKGLK